MRNGGFWSVLFAGHCTVRAALFGSSSCWKMCVTGWHIVNASTITHHCKMRSISRITQEQQLRIFIYNIIGHPIVGFHLIYLKFNITNSYDKIYLLSSNTRSFLFITQRDFNLKKFRVVYNFKIKFSYEHYPFYLNRCLVVGCRTLYF